jgi:hypothetical protein
VPRNNKEIKRKTALLFSSLLGREVLAHLQEILDDPNRRPGVRGSDRELCEETGRRQAFFEIQQLVNEGKALIFSEENVNDAISD